MSQMHKVPKPACARAGDVGCKGKATSNCDLCVPCCVRQASEACHSSYHRRLRGGGARASASMPIAAPVFAPGTFNSAPVAAPVVPGVPVPVPVPIPGAVAAVPIPVPVSGATSAVPIPLNPASQVPSGSHGSAAINSDVHATVNTTYIAPSSSQMSASSSSSFANPLSSIWTENQGLGAYLQRHRDDVLRDEESAKRLEVLRVSERLKKTVQFRVWTKVCALLL